MAGDTDAALSNVKEITVDIRADHQSLLSHVTNLSFILIFLFLIHPGLNSFLLCFYFLFFQYGQMKALFDKAKESQRRTMEKAKEVIAQRNDMRTRMEDAFTAKEAVSADCLDLE